MATRIPKAKVVAATTDEGSRVSISCERRLVHWLNSLPIAASLLVEELAELRFGDVLGAVVAWIRGADGNETLDDASNRSALYAVEQDVSEDGDLQDEYSHAAARARVAAVVQFAAQGCRSEDGDAVYIVNSAACVARVLRGDTEAIVAVLCVLKRISDDKERERAVVAEDARRLVRDDFVRAAVRQRVQLKDSVAFTINRQSAVEPTSRRRASTTSSTTAPARMAKSSRSLRPSTASQKPHQVAATETTGPTAKTAILRDESGLHVYSMVDPRERIAARGAEHRDDRGKKSSSKASVRPRERRASNLTAIKVPSAQKLLEWIESMGVVIPWNHTSPDEESHESSASDTVTRGLLQDGVVLCQLSAAIAHRRASVASRHKLQRLKELPPGVLFPQGATLHPQSVAQERHNLCAAWDLLAECGGLLPVPYSDDKVAFVDAIVTAHAKAWEIVSHIRQRIIYHGRDSVPSRSKSSSPARSSSKIAPMKIQDLSIGSPVGYNRRRPYITTEQINAAKRWMKECGVDPLEMSSGILQDSLRNGAALCELLGTCAQDVSGSVKYHKQPKTLIEVRHNIARAMDVISNLHSCYMPPSYFSQLAMEGVLMGDKQYIFGIIWHLWQYTMQESAKVDADMSVEILDKNEHETEGLPIAEIEPEPHHTVDRAPPARAKAPRCSSSPFLRLDVPAAVLASEDMRGYYGGGSLSESQIDVAWDDYPMRDDLFPIFDKESNKRQSYRHYEGQLEGFDDIVPTQRSEHASRERTAKSWASPRIVGAEPQSSDDQPSQRDPPDTVLEPAILFESEPTTASAVAATKETTPPCIEQLRSPTLVRPDSALAKEAVQWLRKLGINLQHPDDFHDSSSKLKEFRSGVLLCTIVEKLEHMRCLEGVNRKECISKASALHNITKALDILQRRKAVPIALIRRKQHICDGDRDTILMLLFCIRKAYGHHLHRKSPYPPGQVGKATAAASPQPRQVPLS